MKQENHNKESKKKLLSQNTLEFIRSNVAGLGQLVISRQYELAELFELKEFNSGIVLIREGQKIYFDYKQKNVSEENTPAGSTLSQYNSPGNSQLSMTPRTQIDKRNQNDYSNYIYLIVSGIVRYETLNNPFRKINYTKQNILQKTHNIHKIYDVGGGKGHMGTTLNKTILGNYTQGSWVGLEFEVLHGSIPTFYSAICESKVQALAIDRKDFQLLFPQSIKNKMEVICYNKLYQLRDKLKIEDEKKLALQDKDQWSKNHAKTMNHMQDIYPQATLAYHKKMNQNLLERSNFNTRHILTLKDARQETKREDYESKRVKEGRQKQKSFKSVIHNRAKSFFNEHERLQNIKVESKFETLPQRTLYTLDHRDVAISRQHLLKENYHTISKGSLHNASSQSSIKVPKGLLPSLQQNSNPIQKKTIEMKINLVNKKNTIDISQMEKSYRLFDNANTTGQSFLSGSYMHGGQNVVNTQTPYIRPQFAKSRNITANKHLVNEPPIFIENDLDGTNDSIEVSQEREEHELKDILETTQDGTRFLSKTKQSSLMLPQQQKDIGIFRTQMNSTVQSKEAGYMRSSEINLNNMTHADVFSSLDKMTVSNQLNSTLSPSAIARGLNKQPLYIRQPINSNKPGRKLLFNDRQAYQAFKDQSHLEFRIGQMQSIPVERSYIRQQQFSVTPKMHQQGTGVGKFSHHHHQHMRTNSVRRVPMTEDIAYLQSIMEIKGNWQRDLHVAKHFSSPKKR